MTFNIKVSIDFTDFKANAAFHHNFKAFKAHFLYKGKQTYILYVYPFIKKKLNKGKLLLHKRRGVIDTLRSKIDSGKSKMAAPREYIREERLLLDRWKKMEEENPINKQLQQLMDEENPINKQLRQIRGRENDSQTDIRFLEDKIDVRNWKSKMLRLQCDLDNMNLLNLKLELQKKAYFENTNFDRTDSEDSPLAVKKPDDLYLEESKLKAREQWTKAKQFDLNLSVEKQAQLLEQRKEEWEAQQRLTERASVRDRLHQQLQREHRLSVKELQSLVPPVLDEYLNYQRYHVLPAIVKAAKDN